MTVGEKEAKGDRERSFDVESCLTPRNVESFNLPREFRDKAKVQEVTF
jgi:hypothetical protein